jgi:hypothetical protein
MAVGDRFHPLFERWARRVRGRLMARRVLTGLALGLGVAIVPAAVAWKTRHGPLRPLSALVGIAGAAAGAWVARRRRWSDVEVALWLDDRLATEETITTAVELRSQAEGEAPHARQRTEPDTDKAPQARQRTEPDTDDARAVVLSSAGAALARADAKRARPSVFRPLHALAPIAAAGLVLVARSPLPAPPAVVHAPGDATVQIAHVEGLKRVAQLGEATARDDAQRERLEKIAKDADKLRADLERGLEKREALDRIARLRDAIAAERLTLGEGEKRAGLEAAISKLAEEDVTREASKALGDHDLERMDREMERIANAREKRDREAAKRALAEAAAAAKANGARDVGRALEQEKKSLEERERRAEALRDLEKAMEDSGSASTDVQSEAEALDRKGSDDAARKLADAMGRALEKLTPEQRKRLAEKLRERAAKGGKASDPQMLKDLAEELSTPEGQKKLEEELKELAAEDDESAESKGQRGLDDAEEGAQGAEGEIQGQGRQPGQSDGEGGGGQGAAHGGAPIPIPGRGGSGSDGSGGTGSHHDTGTGPHDGKTEPVSGAGTLKSRARGPLNRAPGMPGSTTGWTAGRSGGTANVQGTGALGAAGPSEIDGVDQSDVPQEYREQVRQYFQP